LSHATKQRRHHQKKILAVAKARQACALAVAILPLTLATAAPQVKLLFKLRIFGEVYYNGLVTTFHLGNDFHPTHFIYLFIYLNLATKQRRHPEEICA
jgi:hypothetical protein